MTAKLYVFRDGKIVEKTGRRKLQASDFPTPMLSRFEPIESPVTGKEITSWRERDRDMDAVGCVDPRDLDRKPFEKREAEYAKRRAIDAAERGGTDTAD